MTNSTKSPNHADRRIGQRIRWRRMAIGMSQEALAKALNLTFQQVQKYERGINRVSAGRLEEIAQVLEVPVLFFFDDDTQVPPLMLDTPQNLALMRAFTAIEHPDLQRLALSLVQTIAAMKEEG